ncbi:hypothetical protein EGW08_018475, partial [Elysia chlorotica]
VMMADLFSPRSSVTSGSTDSTCLPRRRIKCTKSQIAVGECRFESASDALLAYLGQFDGTGGEDGPATGKSDLRLAVLANSETMCGTSGHVTEDGTSRSNLAESLRHESRHVVGKESLQHESRHVVGKGLAGSGLVLAPRGIAVAGTREDVEDLLTSKVSAQLHEEVTDTLREVKLRRLLKQAALKSKNQSKTGLQQEVEAALLRSAELLDKVTREVIPGAHTPLADESAVSSPNSSTLNSELEMLLLGGAGHENDVHERQARTGHTYSYRRSRSTRSRQRAAPTSYTVQLGVRSRSLSLDNLPPATLKLLAGEGDSTSSDSAPSNQSDPTELLRQVRSRSESPGRARRHWLGQLDASVSQSVPSWVGEMSGCEASDSLWVHEALLQDDSNKRRPAASVPSWVGQAEVSDINDQEEDSDCRPPLVPLMSTPIKPMATSNNLDFNVSAKKSSVTTSANGCPYENNASTGLNFSDLNTSLPNHKNGPNNDRSMDKSNNSITYTASLNTILDSDYNGESALRHSILPQAARLDHSSPRPSRVLDSDYNGESALRHSILPQAARLRRSMDTFAASSESLGQRSASSSASSEGSGVTSVLTGPCSSLDTVALLSGNPLTRS